VVELLAPQLHSREAGGLSPAAQNKKFWYL